MTENCGTCTRTYDGDPTCAGTIGALQPVCEIKLVDIPSMSYLTDDKPNPRGELCVRGSSCFKGYYKGTSASFPFSPRTIMITVRSDEKNTQETLKGGWIHSGDVAEIDSCGRLKIIDRVKACGAPFFSSIDAARHARGSPFTGSHTPLLFFLDRTSSNWRRASTSHSRRSRTHTTPARSYSRSTFTATRSSRTS